MANKKNKSVGISPDIHKALIKHVGGIMRKGKPASVKTVAEDALLEYIKERDPEALRELEKKTGRT